ncbi:hypothetical protein KY285_031187 [Solanum tuberosum]|nr:hypothetical protein KY285_031187 [Solanum tuberosum]
MLLTKSTPISDKEKIERDALSVIQLSLAPNVLCEDHLDTFNKLVMDLETAGIKKDDETLACAFLFSLTSKYRDIENSMMYSKKSITLEQVRQTLNSCDVRMHFEGDKGDETSGLFVRGRTSQQGRSRLKYRSKSRVNKKNAECWSCHKKRHFERDCPMLKSNEKASASIVEQVHDSDDYVLITSCNSGVYDNKWVLDSGCTLYMTFRKDWFSSYETSGGTVLMGNNATCKIVGIGSIRVRCHDGIVRTITEVRHVLDLKKNLISLGTLDKQGYKYMSEGGTMKVTKRSLVMLKAKLEDGLYTLAGNTFIGSVNESIVQLSNDDKAKLWHMRLGKQKKVSFNTGKHNIGGVLDYIHSDLWGLSKLPSKGGKMYLLTFIDDFSQKVWVRFLKAKDTENSSGQQQEKSVVHGSSGNRRKRGRPRDAEANRATTAAKMFTPENPYFMITLGEYHVVRNYILNIPPEFVRDYMPKTSEPIKLQNSDGNKGTAHCLRRKTCMFLSKGWVHFVRDNNSG